MSKSLMEINFLEQLKDLGLPLPEREFMFALPAGRRFRADFAYPDLKILIEIEGGVWIRGIYQSRHTEPTGYEVDCRKYNLAAQLGYRVFRFTGNMLNADDYGLLSEAAAQIKEVLDWHMHQQESMDWLKKKHEALVQHHKEHHDCGRGPKPTSEGRR